MNVRTGVPSCHWEAASLDDWIVIVGINDTHGNGDAHFTVRPNATGAARTGTVVVGEVAWKVHQQG